jgi:hypothetical protein
MKLLQLLFVLLCFGVFGGCFHRGSSATPYPRKVSHAFVNSCRDRGQDREFCRCALRELERRVPVQSLVSLSKEALTAETEAIANYCTAGAPVTPYSQSSTPSNAYKAYPSGGQLQLYYKAPQHEVYGKFKTLFTESAIPQTIQVVNQLIQLPRNIPVVIEECGEPNAFYFPDSHSISLCFELPVLYLSMLKDKFSPQENINISRDATTFSFLHEFGHALIAELNLPTTGREEDAVDEFATVYLILTKQSSIVRAGALALLKIGELDGNQKYYDEHSFSKQRFANVLCLLYGSNPGENANLVPTYLPKERAIRCVDEYSKKSHAWSALISPHLQPQK